MLSFSPKRLYRVACNLSIAIARSRVRSALDLLSKSERKIMDLIYCAGSNERLMQIAHDAGYLIGIRSDYLDYGFPISFVDVHYKEPDFTAHMEVVKKLHPKYATVPDLSEVEVSE